MKAETADYLEKARATLADARQIVALPLPHIAAREAFLAVYGADHTNGIENSWSLAQAQPERNLRKRRALPSVPVSGRTGFPVQQSHATEGERFTEALHPCAPNALPTST